MKILGIETSCDETAVAVYDGEKGLLGHQLHRQIAMHNDYGGVVPELASRDHIQKLLPLIQVTLKDSGVVLSDIDAIAYTAGPGLIGALLVGATAARTLAWSLNIPCIPVHHMEGHLLAPFLEGQALDYPFVALLVSGGHTLLVHVQGFGEYVLLGESLDDAVGEAFDKTARLLGMSYPGGPEIAALAEKGDAKRFDFPRPMVDRPGLDFSFSGLKTFVLRLWEQSEKTEKDKADIAAGFQLSVAETLTIKCRRALEQTGCKHLVVAGGVGANLLLREHLDAMAVKMNGQVTYPKLEFCMDNGAMIAYAGYLRLLNEKVPSLDIDVKARWPLTEI